MSNILPNFELAQRESCKASIMLEGLTGKGKSGLALMLGYGLAGGFNTADETSDEEKWKKIFAVDTENRSLNLFINIPASFGNSFKPFYVHQLSSEDGYAPSNYLTIRKAAVQNGAEVFIADSITHMWTAKGGVLDIVNQTKQENPKLDNYRVWGSKQVMDEKQRLLDVVRDKDCHVITTVRVREKFGMEWNIEKNKNEVVSLGEQQLQQEGLKYEPDLVLHMISPGGVLADGNVRNPIAKVIKSRYAIFAEGETYEFTPSLCEQLRKYLSEGVDPAELLEKQRLDYVAAITNILDTNASANAIWDTLKKDVGYTDVALTEIPLQGLKTLYNKLITD